MNVMGQMGLENLKQVSAPAYQERTSRSFEDNLAQALRGGLMGGAILRPLADKLPYRLKSPFMNPGEKREYSFNLYHDTEFQTDSTTFLMREKDPARHVHQITFRSIEKPKRLREFLREWRIKDAQDKLLADFKVNDPNISYGEVSALQGRRKLHSRFIQGDPFGGMPHIREDAFELHGFGRAEHVKYDDFQPHWLHNEITGPVPEIEGLGGYGAYQFRHISYKPSLQPPDFEALRSLPIDEATDYRIELTDGPSEYRLSLPGHDNGLTHLYMQDPSRRIALSNPSTPGGINERWMKRTPLKVLEPDLSTLPFEMKTAFRTVQWQRRFRYGRAGLGLLGLTLLGREIIQAISADGEELSATTGRKGFYIANPVRNISGLNRLLPAQNIGIGRHSFTFAGSTALGGLAALAGTFVGGAAFAGKRIINSPFLGKLGGGAIGAIGGGVTLGAGGAVAGEILTERIWDNYIDRRGVMPRQA